MEDSILYAGNYCLCKSHNIRHRFSRRISLTLLCMLRYSLASFSFSSSDSLLDHMSPHLSCPKLIFELCTTGISGRTKNVAYSLKQKIMLPAKWPEWKCSTWQFGKSPRKYSISSIAKSELGVIDRSSRVEKKWSLLRFSRGNRLSFIDFAAS